MSDPTQADDLEPTEDQLLDQAIDNLDWLHIEDEEP
jgi:hypothetical protein